MKQLTVKSIVLRRTDYQEADRIITVLTRDQGKLRIMAKGARRAKSKLAGGIELFSTADLTVQAGRGELYRLISSRLDTHYGNIVKDIDRTMLAYACMKRIDKITEDAAEPEYFAVLQQVLISLNDSSVPATYVDLWMILRLLQLGGHAPNLRLSADGLELDPEALYHFDIDAMAFREHAAGSYSAMHIKMLRLAFAVPDPKLLVQVVDGSALMASLLPVVHQMIQTQYHMA